MHRLYNWLIGILAACIVLLAALNLQQVMTPTSIDLLLTRVEAPLGLVMLGLTAMLTVLAFVATLGQQLGSLIESRRLMKELQRARTLAESAESSRIDKLQLAMADEFRRLHERLDALDRRAATMPDEIVDVGSGRRILSRDSDVIARR